MLLRIVVITVLAGTGIMFNTPSPAAGGEQTQQQAQQRIFGSQLMTPRERAEYRAKLRAAKTLEERQKIRAEHHRQMLERAKERGVTLPEMPPPGGGMMGPGGGMGGMGPPR